MLESIEMMDRLAGAIEKFRGQQAAPTGSSNWVESLISGLAPLLAPLINVLAARAMAPPQPAPPGGLPPGGIVPAAIQPNTPATPAEPPPEFFNQWAMMIVNALQQNFDGTDFAHSIAVQQGQMIYLQLAGLGIDGILQRLKSTPNWPAMAAIEPAVRQFVTEFVQWKEEWQEGNDDEKTTNVSTTAAGKPGATTTTS